MKTITLEEAFAKATKGKLTSQPFTVPDWDDDPLGVYVFESARQRLEGLYAAADVKSPELDAVHAENRMNAALLAHCFNCFEELYDSLFNLVDDWERVHGPIPDDHEAKAILAKANKVTLP